MYPPDVHRDTSGDWVGSAKIPRAIGARPGGFDRELGGVHVSHGRKPVEKDARKEQEPPKGAIDGRKTSVTATHAADRIEFHDA